MGTAPPAGALNPNGSINSRGSFCALLNGALPAQGDSFTGLFDAWTAILMGGGASQQVVNNVKGEWYEWLIAICAWNYRAEQNPAAHVAVKLPNVTQFEVSSLYEPQLHGFITDLREKVEASANVSLVTSNPDFAIIRHGAEDVPAHLLNPIAQVDDAGLTLLDSAHLHFTGRCTFEEIAGYVCVKATLRPDRRLQLPHEASLMKALYMHLQTRQWILKPKGLRYYAIAAEATDADEAALRTVATASIVNLQIAPQRAVDAVHTVDSFSEGFAVMAKILSV